MSVYLGNMAEERVWKIARNYIMLYGSSQQKTVKRGKKNVESRYSVLWEEKVGQGDKI